MNLFLILVIVLIVNALITRLCILNFLKIIKRNHTELYKKFGSLSTADSYHGRDIIATWHILTNEFEEKKLITLKFILAVSTLITIIFFILIMYGYIHRIFS